MTWYYRAETKGIQDWIFATSKLREIRGGSALIEGLAELAAAADAGTAGAEPLQLAAGAVAFRFDDREELARFAREWPRRVASAAPGLQVVQAWVPEHDDDDDRGWQVRLGERLRARRNLPVADLPEAGPWVERRGRSGLPAIARRDAPRTRDGLLHDAASAAKAQVEGRSRWQRVKVDEDLVVDLKLAPDGEGLLAVVHADGTGVGRRVLEVPTQELPEFSKALASCAEDALIGAIGEVARARETTTLDLQIVLLGGDDLTFACEASLALDLTRQWLERFEQLTAERLSGGGLRAGAGIAITSRRYPFWRAYELSERLCKRAKSVLKDGDRALDSALSFSRVTTSAGESRLSQGVWRLGADIDSPVPTLGILETLHQAARKLARGALRDWLTAFESHVHEALDRADTSGGDTAAILNPGPGAGRLWTRMKETRPETFAKLAAALDTINPLRQDGAGPRLAVEDTAWTPIRDALLVSTVGRRAPARRHVTEGEEQRP